MANHRKAWIIGGSIAAGVVVLAGVGILIASLMTVSKEDYTAAATTTTDVAKQSDAYGTALQEYSNGIAQQFNASTLATLQGHTNTSLDEVLTSQEKLSKSPALRDPQVKVAYDAYNKKAQAFKEVATGYRTSMPLYVTMYTTCHEAFKTTDPSENIFKALFEFAQSATDFANGGITKDEALKRFDEKGKDCLPAATALQKSGTNTFAKMGGLVVTVYSNTRNGIVEKYDNPNYNASEARAKSSADNDQKFKDLQAGQKKEATDTDYTSELKTLNQLLNDKAAKK